MTSYASDAAFSPAVKAAQDRLGSRKAYARMEEKGWRDRVTPDLAAYIAERDSLYLATASADGQPYIQHRGGAKGFLKVLDDKTLAFADFGGNKQFITLGNLSENDKANLFLMDYANRQRIKIWGRAEMIEDDVALMERLADDGYKGKPERALLFHITVWDSNCPQHITPRYTEDHVASVIGQLQQRIVELEGEVALLRSGA